MNTKTNQPGAITSPILVTGAAGQVGSVGFKIVELLRGKGISVRRMVRRDDDRSKALAKLGAEIVKGDLTDLGNQTTLRRWLFATVKTATIGLRTM